LGILGRSPDLGFVTDHVGRAVLRLHGRVSEERRLILRIDSLCGFRKPCCNISLFAPNAGIGCTQASAHKLRDGLSPRVSISTIRPADLERFRSWFGSPP